MSSLSRAHEVHNAADTVMPLIHDHSTSEAPGDAEENLTSSTCTKTQNGDHAHRQCHFRAASAGFTSFASSLLIFPLVSGWLSLERPGHESIFERNLTWAPLVSAVRWSEPDALLVLLFLALYAVSTFSFRSARCHDPWQDVIIAVFLSSDFFVVVTVVVLKGHTNTSTASSPNTLRASHTVSPGTTISSRSPSTNNTLPFLNPAPATSPSSLLASNTFASTRHSSSARCHPTTSPIRPPPTSRSSSHPASSTPSTASASGTSPAPALFAGASRRPTTHLLKPSGSSGELYRNRLRQPTCAAERISPPGATSVRLRTRCGLLAANAAATAPPKEYPSRWNASSPVHPRSGDDASARRICVVYSRESYGRSVGASEASNSPKVITLHPRLTNSPATPPSARHGVPIPCSSSTLSVASSGPHSYTRRFPYDVSTSRAPGNTSGGYGSSSRASVDSRGSTVHRGDRAVLRRWSSRRLAPVEPRRRRDDRPGRRRAPDEQRRRRHGRREARQPEAQVREVWASAPEEPVSHVSWCCCCGREL
ncbi:hypothetical protein CFRS1_v009269 [Colletotrichum fructicola]|nr:hypothetical protein CFRS1_v009269 [Colletotrichum fructicola]